MGFLTALTIFIALIVDFLFLPPLLMLLDKDKKKATQSTGAIVEAPIKKAIEAA